MRSASTSATFASEGRIHVRQIARGHQFALGASDHLPSHTQLVFQRDRFQFGQVQQDRQFGWQAQAKLELVER